MILAELISHPHWFWLTLGGLLLAAEMLGTSGYLLWSGLSAVMVGLLVWIMPFSWQWQGMSFALLTIASALCWFRWISQREKHEAPSPLNQRARQMIGMQLTLSTPIVAGFGHVRLGDGSWRVQANETLPAGTLVTVVAVEGITLRVVPYG